MASETLSDIYNLVVRLDERQALMSGTVDRIERAVYGNGDPGIKSRLEGIERIQATGCPALTSVMHTLEKIDERHSHEDDAIKSTDDAKKDNRRELRKFYYSIIGGVIIMALDIILRISGLLK